MPSQQTTASKQPSQNSSTYDLFILALIVISLVTTVIFYFPDTGYAATSIALFVDFIVSMIFMFDFFRSLYIAPNKLEYLKWGWMDFLGSLPAYPIFRLFRIWRFVRGLRILRKNSLTEMLHTYADRPAESSLLTTALFGILLLGTSSYFILISEINAPNANIESAPDAIWWTMTTVTTVGYGDRFPVTVPGRVVAILVMISGIALFSVITSYLSNFFVSAGDREGDQRVLEIQQELAEVKQMLQQLLEQSETSKS